MNKVLVKARKLTEADVQFVSLVKRGANQMPFKVIKSEDGMIDLSKIDVRKIFGGKAPDTAVAAILVKSDVGLENAKALVAKAGFSADSVQETEDGFVFAQTADQPKTAVVVKMNDKVAVVVSNVRKYLETSNYSTTSFTELLSQEGFWPGLETAKSVLNNVLLNIVSQAKSSEEAASLAQAAVKDFGKLVVELFGSVPTMAFKMDDPALLEVKAEAPAEAVVTKTEGEPVTTKDATAAAATPAATEVKKDEVTEAAPAAEQKPAETAAADAPAATTEAAPAAVAKDAAPDIAAMFADLKKSVGESINAAVENLRTGVDKSIAGVNDAIKELGGRVSEVEKVAKAADEAVNGTVGGKAPADRKPVAKSDESRGSAGLIDTAYDRVS